MRIISNFRDYYDVIQGQGQDLSLIYHRVTREERLTDYRLPDLVPARWYGTGSVLLSGYVVGFCGKLWPAVTVSTWKSKTGVDAGATCFTAEQLLDWIGKTLKGGELKDWNSKSKRRPGSLARWRVLLETFFREIDEQHENHLALFHRFNAPIFTVRVSCSKRVRDEQGYETRINPRLSGLEFQRVLDPYTAFQELSIFLGAQAQPEKMIPDVTDADMIVAKGFDKFSFRKEPSKRRR